MLEMKFIRENVDAVRNGAAAKGITIELGSILSGDQDRGPVELAMRLGFLRRLESPDGRVVGQCGGNAATPIRVCETGGEQFSLDHQIGFRASKRPIIALVQVRFRSTILHVEIRRVLDVICLQRIENRGEKNKCENKKRRLKTTNKHSRSPHP